MRTNSYILFLLACFAAMVIQPLFAQDTAEKREYIPMDAVEEKIVLEADKTLFSVDESIKFRAVYLTKQDPGSIQWSTVLYVELTGSDGRTVSRSKYRLSADGTSGIISFPEHLPSGIYYLKAYTRWMRNYPTDRYAYYFFKLVNPYETSQIMRNGGSGHGAVKIAHRPADSHISIATDKARYGAREKVNVTLVAEDMDESPYTCCVSVVRAGLKSIPVSPEGWTKAGEDMGARAIYYPEINGISLSGKVVNPEDNKPVTDAVVTLSLLGDMSFYSEMQTSEEGEFFFTFPYSEKSHDLYMNVEKENMKLDLQIDNDFCRKPVATEMPDFSLSAQEETLAAEMIVNAQIAKKYNENLKMEESGTADSLQRSFYGSPDKVYYTRDYIDLPEVKEFIFEIVPDILVTTLKNQPVIHSARVNVFYYYPFLIMLDNIPVTDAAAFLAIKTNTIERFEIIDNSFVIGSAKFNGILSAFSKKQDLAGIDLPKNAMFFKYQMYAGPEPEMTDSSTDPRVPDRRTELYWNPDMKLQGTREVSISFSTSDIPGEYEIIISRISGKDGEISYSKAVLVVE